MTFAELHGPEARGHVVVCGLEGLSVRTLQELDRLGERAVVVAADIDPRFRDEIHGLAASVIEGDPRDANILRQAGIAHAAAIVLTSSDDVGNIHTVLAAHAINPSIHAVVRTFDEDFGRGVEGLMPDVVALSASALAAPGFVTAILDEDADERWIDVLGRTFALRHVAPTDPSVLVPLADDSVSPVVLFPTTGDRLLCLVDAAGERADTQTAEPAGRSRALPGRPRFGALRRVDRRFWVLGGVLALITFGSAMVFSATTNIDIVESIYDVVGAFFGGVDPSVANGTALKIFAIFLTLVGAAALAVFYGLIADVVLSTRISNFLGPQPTDADHHVIVVGLGTIGFRIAAMLRDRDIPVVAAERQVDGRFVDAARELRIAVVNTDARTQQALRALGVERARALVAATDDDAANLTSALLARSMRPDMRIVVRLFDPDLAAQLESAIGDYNSRSVSALAAPAFAAAAVGRRVLATIPVGPRRLLIVARVPVEAGSPADGSTITVEEQTATHVEMGGLQVLAVVVGDEVRWAPDDSDPVTPGMELLVVATRRGLATVVRRSAGPHAEGFGDIAHDAEQESDEGAAPGSETDAREDVSQPASA